MNVSAGSVYLVSVVLLFIKYAVAITVQARERMRLRHFRYPEDAAYWMGTVAEDSDLCHRAQNLLRNDCENQPFYLVFGAAYAALGLGPGGAFLYFGGYVLSRLSHGYFMLRARQPHRNRAFALGVSILAVLAVHLTYACVSQSDLLPCGDRHQADVRHHRVQLCPTQLPDASRFPGDVPRTIRTDNLEPLAPACSTEAGDEQNLELCWLR